MEGHTYGREIHMKRDDIYIDKYTYRGIYKQTDIYRGIYIWEEEYIQRQIYICLEHI